MALIGSFTKQPGEILDFDISYATVLLGRTDTIVTKTVTVAPAGLTLVSSTIFNNNLIKVVVSAGTDAISYKVTVSATSTAGLIYEDEITILVTEI